MEEMIDMEGLTEEEKTLILSVIRRDEELRKEQDTRASQLRSEIHNLRLQSVIRDGDDLNKICARCHKPFGFIFNTGDVCSQCKFRVCGVCRESLLTGKWLCTLCYKQVQLKGLTGEWIQDNVNNEKRRQSQSGIDLVKASLRHSLSNGTVSKTRDGDSGDGVPDTKRGVTRQDSASREDIDRVGYPKNADKKRLSNLFETFKSSKDVPDNDEQDIKHVSCRRHNVSDSDSGSSSDGETPMDVADSKTQSSDQVSSTSAAILAQNLSETESASDLRRDQKESPERKVPNGESQPNSGETVEGAESASTERSRNSVSPEKRKMTPTEAVIFSKRFSGTQDQLMVSQPSSSNSPVSPVCNMSHSPDHKTSIVRRTSSEKSDTSSMSSARTASPATKMRLLDMASKRALERESFDQEESGHDSPRHKPEDTPSNGVNRLRLQPSRTTGGSSSPVRPSSPQSDICSGSDSDVMEVAEFPLYMSPRHSQEAPLSGELSGTEENQLSGEPSSPGAEELNEAENHFGMKETEGADDKRAHGLNEGTDYEDVMETKSEPSHPCQHITEGHVPDATSTPNHLEETIDDEHLFQLVSMSRPQVTCPPSQHSQTRRSKDDSELEHVKPSPSAAVTSTAASSAATVTNLSTIGLIPDNDEGDPFASGPVDISDALQRYLRQEVDELSDCLSVITERTEPEEDELSELSEALDDTMEDEDLDKEIEKIYQANISIESYCSSDNLSSGSAAAAIRKARREQQKKHIEEVLASPTSFQLQVISEGFTDKPVQSKEEPSEQESDTESVDKVSITSDTISACLSDMSSVDHSNRQTPTSSILVSVDDGAVGNADTNSSDTTSEEQDSAWFDMSLSVDSVKELPTAKNSSSQDASMSASTETLCDEDLPQDDVANVDDDRTTPEPHVPETDTNLDSKETLEGNKLVNEKDISNCLKQVSIENDINNANVPQSDSDFPSIPLVPGHDPDATSVPSETLHPISNTSSPPDLHLQDLPVTLTSPTAASPSSPLPECQPDVGVIPPGMSDRTSETESHGGDSGHISGTSAENTPEHKSRHHSHLSIPSLVLTSTSAEEQQDREEEDDIDDLVASHKSIGSLRGSRGNLHSSLTDSRESLYSVYSDAGEINFGNIPATGEILFGLDYNYKTGALEIHIKQCKDIAPVDTKRNRSDPYVKTYLLPDKTRSGKRKTKIKKHTLSPTFDEVLRYVISKSEVENRALWVTVWHNDRFGRNDFLGEVMIPMDCYKFGDASLKWYPLQDRLDAPGAQPVSYKGDLVLSVKFVTAENLDNDGSRKGKSKKGKAPPRGELQVLVKEAKNLTAVRSNGSSDPFCKAYLLPEKNKSNKQKSAVVKRNCNPTWNHVFLFEDVSLEEMKDRSLELTVWDYDKITSNDFLGGVRLNIGTGVASGKTVEWMDARGEEIAIWQSSIDRPNCWNDGTIGLRATMGKSEIRK
ncbi:synaptotagmin-like protein 2 isoform X3 [Haliotis rufescens]|uniref:synaptotagmin-like protein 2 isoform X3 n=1 Tax=Haliotis rufescens TaxID=6454 RepID=UPI00201F2109|nr:synaptotagmin-like protein 2 isoform X3 [Haliotis rufescens]